MPLLKRTLDHLIANVGLWLTAVGLLLIEAGVLVTVVHGLGHSR